MMTDFLLLVTALGTLATFAVALRIAGDLRALRAEHIPDMLASLGKLSGRLGPRPTGLFNHPGPGSHHHFEEGDDPTWEWRDGCWQLVVESVPAGVDPGAPPAYPGAFTGERVKTWIRGSLW